MRDLEIRGAGNILGAEQHGHMMAVGFNLYSRLLREAVRRIKGEEPPPPGESTIDIRVDAYIPDRYVPDNEMKIDIYKRIGSADSLEAVDRLREELSDRFGAPPGEVEALIEVQALRVISLAAGVRKVGLVGGVIEAEFAPGRAPKPATMKRVLKECDTPLEFDSRAGLLVRFRAPRDRRGALRLGRMVLKHFAPSANLH
jgi:transcription-repair coupling factor (superfamily II helicase)